LLPGRDCLPRQGWINTNQLAVIADSLTKSGYGDYLFDLLARDT